MNYSSPGADWQMKEHRLCFAQATPRETLDQSAEVLGSRSEVIADALKKTKELPPDERGPDFAKELHDGSKWREAWAAEGTYTAAAVAGAVVDDPQTYLSRLDKAERKQLLLKYLQERFPKYAVAGDADFDKITGTDFSAIAGPGPALSQLLEGVRAFLYMGAKMRREAVDAGTAADVRINARSGELNDAAKDELRERFANAKVLSDEFRAAITRHPEIGVAMLSDAGAIKRILSGDQGYLAAALEQGIVTDDQLRRLCGAAAKAMTERQKVAQSVAGREAEIKNALEANQERGLMEKVVENWSGLEGWQKLVIAGIGLFTAYKWGEKIVKKGFGLGDAFVGVPILFYISGGRQLVEGTTFGNALAQAEKWVNRGFNAAVSRTSPVPEITPRRAETYSRFFVDVAGVEMKDELEAMEYLSMVPINAVADSVSLAPDGMSGVLNVKENSPLVREIRKSFGEEVGDRVIAKMRRMKTGLGTALARVFFLLGATAKPTEHRKIEKARMATAHQRYEELPPAERQAFRELVIEGQGLATSSYAGLSWYEVIGILLEKGSKR